MVTAIFMAIMSMFYLQQIPTQADLDQLEDDIRREHGLYLSAAAPLNVTLTRPQNEGERSGVEIRVAMRPDLRNKKKTATLYLNRIAESVLIHPDWIGKIGYVRVAEFRAGGVSVTRKPLTRPPPEAAAK